MRARSSDSRRAQRAVERRTRAHHGVGLFGIRAVIAADVDRLPLHGVQLADDRLLVLRKRLRELREMRLQLTIFALCGKRLRPVEREVEVTAAIVDLAGARPRRLVALEELAGRFVERLRQNLRPLVTRLDAEI